MWECPQATTRGSFSHTNLERPWSRKGPLQPTLRLPQGLGIGCCHVYPQELRIQQRGAVSPGPHSSLGQCRPPGLGVPVGRNLSAHLAARRGQPWNTPVSSRASLVSLWGRQEAVGAVAGTWPVHTPSLSFCLCEMGIITVSCCMGQVRNQGAADGGACG